MLILLFVSSDAKVQQLFYDTKYLRGKYTLNITFLVIFLHITKYYPIFVNLEVTILSLYSYIYRYIIMVQFTADTEQIGRAYNLQPQEVILSFALAAGAPHPDAYRLIYHIPSKVSNNELSGTVQALLTNKPSLKILIQRIKNHQNPVSLKKEVQQAIQQTTSALYNSGGKQMTEEEVEAMKNELTTRDGLIKNLIDSVSLSSGKDKISGLQTLAKLQGFDKPDEINEDDKRTYFLPWVSHCRTCELMKLYKQIIEKQTGEQETP